MVRNEDCLIRGRKKALINPPVFPCPECGLFRAGYSNDQPDIRPGLSEAKHRLSGKRIKPQRTTAQKGTDSPAISHFQTQRDFFGQINLLRGPQLPMAGKAGCFLF